MDTAELIGGVFYDFFAREIQAFKIKAGLRLEFVERERRRPKGCEREERAGCGWRTGEACNTQTETAVEANPAGKEILSAGLTADLLENFRIVDARKSRLGSRGIRQNRKLVLYKPFAKKGRRDSYAGFLDGLVVCDG